MFAEVELDREHRTVARPRPQSLPLEGARWCRQRDCERLEEGLRREVMREAVDQTAPPVRIPFRGGYIVARPIDTRRFVRAMARHVSFN